ncbi:uncharacterized protein C12orf71 homolog isoform X2 [Fukomys damarensis]|nr:uncharacterized protein C12orf71 homolog isoform X2 [Fukomys damarensis]
MLGTDGMRTRVPQCDHNRDDSRWCSRQGIAMTWANDDDFEDSTDNENQSNHKGNQANHQDPALDFFEITPVEDFRLCSCSLAQVRCQEDDAYPDLLTCSSPEEEDAPVPETRPVLRDQCCAETANEMTGSQKSGVPGTSRASSVQAEDGDTCPDSQATTCVNMGRAFRWLKKKILVALHRREDPEKATESGCHRAPKRRRGLRNNRVAPEEAL